MSRKLEVKEAKRQDLEKIALEAEMKRKSLEAKYEASLQEQIRMQMKVKYCITPHPLKSQENALDEINIKNMCHKVWRK